MKHLLLIFTILFCAISKSPAQYYSINLDFETVAKMAAAYNSEAALELYYGEQLNEIRKNYEAAEVGAAGIFASKFMDRKALTNLDVWSSSTENYYYRRIYKMVSTRIMPKIYKVAGMMLKSPQNAIYWGTYLYKVCDETKSLCNQFESVVTNGTLSFKDITFLELNENIAGVLKLTELAGTDWQSLLDSFSDVQGSFTKENLKSDMENLYAMGVNLAGAGYSNALQSITSGCSFSGSTENKISSVITIADNLYTAYQSADGDIGNTIIKFVGGEGGVDKLFNVSDYNTDTWSNNYASGANIDASKLKGMEIATISVTCSDGTKLGEGRTQYKCSKCGKSLSEHTKSCSMSTSISDSDIDTSELESMKTDFEKQILNLDMQIQALKNQNSELASNIAASTSAEEAAIYRQQYNQNSNNISKLESQRASLQQQLDDVEEAIAEAEAGEEVQTDDYNRIPAIMEKCRQTFRMNWQDQGSWSGYTFVRHATIPNINGTVTFKAKISLARKAKYFLGIKIYRAIVQIDWELTTDYSDSEVVATITFDPNASDEQKANELNAKVREVQADYPDCKVSTELAKGESVEEDQTEDTQHLLWASDRLEIAREVDARLTKIYAELVSLEKMMHYKHSIVGMLMDILPYVDTDNGRRLTLTQQCRKRWLRNAASVKHADGYTGKYEDSE